VHYWPLSAIDSLEETSRKRKKEVLLTLEFPAKYIALLSSFLISPSESLAQNTPRRPTHFECAMRG
jgi:hypothetical protein